jgi:tight adherence protein C
MTMVILIGLCAGAGGVGTLYAMRVAPVSLKAIERASSQPAQRHRSVTPKPRIRERVNHAGIDLATTSGVFDHPRWLAIQPSLRMTGSSSERLLSQVIMAVAAGLFGPPVFWAVANLAGVGVPILIPVVISVISVPIGLAAPFLILAEHAKERRRHFRVVLSSFVDLVVLGLAGGVGVEGALLAAADVSSDWAARRLSRVLCLARDTGESAWVALANLGIELGVVELVELSTTLQLAGTEGSRIRASLSSRAVSMRRHEQAEAESSANAMTERLFLPGSLLLLGFLLFVGYPAFSRILTGL